MVDIDEKTSEVVLVIHWKGGRTYSAASAAPAARGEPRSYAEEGVVKAVRVLSRIYSDEMIAGVLNRAKLSTARGNYWTRSLVTSLRANHDIGCHTAQRQAEEGWLNLSHAARLAGVSNRTLRMAIERGYITAERPIASGPWVINKQALTSEAASQFLQTARAGKAHPTVPSPSRAVLDLSIT